jgi:hypothetical protein
MEIGTMRFCTLKNCFKINEIHSVILVCVLYVKYLDDS